MANELGNYVRESREAKGLTRGEAVKKMGYKNIAKGANRLVAVERGEIPDEEFLRKIVNALELDIEKVNGCIKTVEDRREAEYQKWLDEPVPMELHLRLIPGVVGSKPVPSGLSEQKAIDWACAEAKRLRSRCCLALDRRRSVWISRDGDIVEETYARRGTSNIPYMTLKGSGKKFSFNLERKETEND